MGRMKHVTLTICALTAIAMLSGTVLMMGEHISAQAPATAEPGGPGRLPGPGGGRGGPGGRRGGPGGPGGPAGLSPMMLERLDLSDGQRTRVREIVEGQREAQKGLGDQARQLHDKLEMAIAGASFDESTVRTLSADLATIQADMAVARARVFAEVVQILTPEQQTKLKDLQATMRDRQGRGRQGR